MGRKYLGVLFALACALAFAVCALPAVALASSPATSVYVGKTLVSNGAAVTKWKLGSDGELAAAAGSDTVVASYDGSTHTLTFNNLEIRDTEGTAFAGGKLSAALYANGNLTLVLTGDNVLVKSRYGETYGSYDEVRYPGVYIDGDLTVKGTGSLFVSTEGSMYYHSTGIQVVGNLNVASGEIWSYGGLRGFYTAEMTGAYGVQCTNLTVANGASLAGFGDYESTGIKATGTVNVNNNLCFAGYYSDESEPMPVDEALAEHFVQICPAVTLTLKTGDAGITGFIYERDTDVLYEDYTIAYKNPMKLPKNTEIVIKAQLASGRTFVKWSDGTTANPRTIKKLTSSLTLTAISDLPAPPDSSATTPSNSTASSSAKKPTVSKRESQIIATNTDKTDVKGSEYKGLKLKAKAGKKRVTISWKKVSGASGYLIYGAKCGKSMKRIKSVKASKKKWTAKKLKKGTYYKYLVVAYKKTASGKVVLTTSKSVHACTPGGKKGNPTSLSVKKKLTVAVGKSKKLKPTMKSKKKVDLHIAKFRYESKNTSVATVSKTGKVKAKKKGKTSIFVFTQDGRCKTVTVTCK